MGVGHKKRTRAGKALATIREARGHETTGNSHSDSVDGAS